MHGDMLDCTVYFIKEWLDGRQGIWNSFQVCLFHPIVHTRVGMINQHQACQEPHGKEQCHNGPGQAVQEKHCPIEKIHGQVLVYIVYYRQAVEVEARCQCSTLGYTTSFYVIDVNSRKVAGLFIWTGTYIALAVIVAYTVGE